MWKFHSLETLWQDVRYSLRTMRRNPGFTIVALSTIALGIGANTAVFSLINVLMLRKLPVREPGHLVEFLWQYPGDPRRNFFGPTNYEQYRDQNSVFSDLIGTSSFRFEPGDERMGAETLDGECVTGNFFPALEVRPAIGRLIGPQDDRPGTAPVAAVSWSYWKTRFNLDPAILDTRIGRCTRYRDRRHTARFLRTPDRLQAQRLDAGSRSSNQQPARIQADGSIEARRLDRAGARADARARSIEGRAARDGESRSAVAPGHT